MGPAIAQAGDVPYRGDEIAEEYTDGKNPAGQIETSAHGCDDNDYAPGLKQNGGNGRKDIGPQEDGA